MYVSGAMFKVSAVCPITLLKLTDSGSRRLCSNESRLMIQRLGSIELGLLPEQPPECDCSPFIVYGGEPLSSALGGYPDRSAKFSICISPLTPHYRLHREAAG